MPPPVCNILFYNDYKTIYCTADRLIRQSLFRYRNNFDLCLTDHVCQYAFRDASYLSLGRGTVTE